MKKPLSISTILVITFYRSSSECRPLPISGPDLRGKTHARQYARTPIGDENASNRSLLNASAGLRRLRLAVCLDDRNIGETRTRIVHQSHRHFTGTTESAHDFAVHR